MQPEHGQGLILDIDRFSTHDGPGIRMAVFLKGCPLKCQWCHSPESQHSTPELLYQQARCRTCGQCAITCPNQAISVLPDGGGIRIDRTRCVRCFACTKICRTRALRIAGTPRTVPEIQEIARRDQSFYAETGGGVTVSGGEPLMQSEFTLQLMQAIKALNVHTALETSGMGREDALLEIANYTDLLYYDIKLLDNEAHKQYIGAPNEQILSNLRALAENDALRERVCVRTPLIPGVNDSPEHIRAVAHFVHGLGIKRMELMPYNAMADAKYEWIDQAYPLGALEGQNSEQIEALRNIIDEEGLSW